MADERSYIDANTRERERLRRSSSAWTTSRSPLP